MKNRDLINLLNRAAAGLEHLVSLTEKERDELVEDLLQAANDVSNDDTKMATVDLLNQLEGIGIYIPGCDEGQWADASGLSFQRIEAALK